MIPNLHCSMPGLKFLTLSRATFAHVTGTRSLFPWLCVPMCICVLFAFEFTVREMALTPGHVGIEAISGRAPADYSYTRARGNKNWNTMARTPHTHARTHIRKKIGGEEQLNSNTRRCSNRKSGTRCEMFSIENLWLSFYERWVFDIQLSPSCEYQRLNTVSHENVEPTTNKNHSLVLSLIRLFISNVLFCFFFKSFLKLRYYTGYSMSGLFSFSLSASTD